MIDLSKQELHDVLSGRLERIIGDMLDDVERYIDRAGIPGDPQFFVRQARRKIGDLQALLSVIERCDHA